MRSAAHKSEDGSRGGGLEEVGPVVAGAVGEGEDGDVLVGLGDNGGHHGDGVLVGVEETLGEELRKRDRGRREANLGVVDDGLVLEVHGLSGLGVLRQADLEGWER